MTRWFVDRSPHRGIPSVSLRRLLPEAEFVGCQDWAVSGCTSDTRKLNPGQVFVAVKGRRLDGHSFVDRALEHGAAGVVVERPCPEAGRLQVVVRDSRAAHARISHALAGAPADRIRALGVTGASGQGATGLFLRSILEASGEATGSVGRSGWSDGASDRPTGPESPGADGFASMLAAMVERGCESAVLEVDAETIDRREVDGLAFDGDGRHRAGWVDSNGGDRSRGWHGGSSRAGPIVIDADEAEADVLGSVNLEARRVTFGIDRPADVSADRGLTPMRRAPGSGSGGSTASSRSP